MIFFYLTLFLASWGQLQRLSLLNGEVNVYLHEIAMIFFILSMIVANFKKLNHRLIQPILFFLLILLVSWVNNAWHYSPQANIVSFLFWLRLDLYCLFFLCLFLVDRKIIKRGVALFLVLTIIFSYGQYFLYPNLRNLSYLGWDPHEARAFGLFFDTTVSGVIFSMLFLTTVDKIKKKTDLKSSWGVALVASLGLILLTYSRITYISLIPALIYKFWRRIPIRRLTLLLLLFLSLILLLPKKGGESVNLGRTFTVSARLADWKEGLSLWGKHPLLGVGYNRIGAYRSRPTENHAKSAFSSSFLTILAASGMVGFVALIYLLARLFIQSDRATRSIELLIIIASLFDNVLLESFVLLLFFTLFQLSYSRKSP